MSRANQDWSPLGELLTGMRVPGAVKTHIRGHEIWSKWPQIVGDDLARVTAPLEIRSKVLLVQVVHQAWAQQLHFLKPSLLGKIQRLCPETKIKDLQFRVGQVKQKKSSQPSRAMRQNSSPVRLSERQEMSLRAVEDEELRAQIRKAMEASAKRALSS